ncbi:MAG: MFS transporter [Cytophagales bacterium]|nr:MAG: MFS transporter [Cytophagales bacterium]
MFKNNHDPYAALKIPEFRFYILARFLLTLSTQIQEVTVGWQIYEITNDPFSLGLLGLAEAVPAISVALIGGYFADKYNRKVIIVLMTSLLTACSISLYFMSGYPDWLAACPYAYPLYFTIFVSGIARGFLGPALFSFWPQIITDKSIFSNAVTWNSTMCQISSTLGPAIGGLLILPFGIQNTYIFDSALMIFAVFAFASIQNKPRLIQNISTSIWESLTSGISFVFSNQIIIATLTLDLFAVLFGGAVALLPAFAKDILNAGAFEFGLLKAAMGIGSVIIAFSLAYFPIKKKAGKILLGAVAGFGFCMIGFGLSTYLWLSFVFLFFSGVFDGISVVIRGTLIQTHTPPEMKGRVSAVNNIFIGSSNEIGAFESGAAAKIMGLVPSVVFGGCMSLAVVISTYFKAKKLRNLDM